MSNRLPNPHQPTNHPGFSDGRHPKINIFATMPVTAAPHLSEGNVANVNLATYIDPFVENDVHRLMATQPRWMQGLLVRFDTIASVRSLGYSSNGILGVLPGDKVFCGAAINHDAEVGVVGVIHPKTQGWLAFDEDAFNEKKMETIPDLKAHIGKISVSEAMAHNTTRQRSTFYELSNGIYS